MDSTAVTELVEKYIAIWNETDEGARRVMLDEVFTPDGVYVDPMVEADGVAAIDAYIATSQQNFPGMLFSHGAVLTHHDTVHFPWELGTPGEAPAVSGYDVAVFEGGRISRLYGFFEGF
ncbi:nuclear transport factor 2 family protein [Streptomyces sp. NPDC057067]|uniref:Nuclear transport factor 2 family protein n=2 Tax=unclassified Streptomyces TaxID=2593676 RepID=A0AAU1M1B4_9ACTN|nr:MULTISPECIES: nuclear transport factor 2 family protein [unclassified Streptomyces]WSS65715.1 nuclear transport factor 2 family protein [Streptomyces sp. NBC_01177]WSS72708.1 nuclear transport factor 2 family protein [Streptomyces sp. NBC_01175]WSS79746.1 nuclear transport factor 2 family protein [Streptomyces sp. NBC_01174]MDX3432231.1 nuclear transport factor 2 family protein [Streptomyces sp. ME01-18a]RPK35830.1 SnoaL-like domain protein [Streptomyces sp. ADI93-02]